MICASRIERGMGDTAFYERKLLVANFFMQRMLPQTEWLSRLSQLGASEVMAVSEDAL